MQIAAMPFHICPSLYWLGDLQLRHFLSSSLQHPTGEFSQNLALGWVPLMLLYLSSLCFKPTETGVLLFPLIRLPKFSLLMAIEENCDQISNQNVVLEENSLPFFLSSFCHLLQK